LRLPDPAQDLTAGIFDVEPEQAMGIGPEPFRDGSGQVILLPTSNTALAWCANNGTETTRRVTGAMNPISLCLISASASGEATQE
jgi:hypothetical protein